jgi:hypothetical protein
MNKNIQNIIKEKLNGYIPKKSCDCGCNTCHSKPKISLNESLLVKPILSEGLQYHLNNKLPLHESVYRAGSEKYFSLLREARSLYSRNVLNVKGDDEELLRDLNTGEFGIYEGQQVPLDYPMEEENPIDTISMDIPLFIRLLEYAREDAKTDMDLHTVTEKITKLSTEGETLTMDDYDSIIGKELNEAKDKKHPPLNKPHRGGSKKFYVYVRNPKTKKIKKVSFGDTTGLKAKINNPKARQAFAKRQRCADAKDKTTARYWACRLPRFSKLLGLKGSFSGYW